MKTIFAIADIHGFFGPMRQALGTAGYDPDNPDHRLVCCGDFFDRGPDNDKVLAFFLHVPHAVCIRGNHDQRLLDIMQQRYVQSYDYANGTVDTLHQLFGVDCVAHGGIFMTPADHPMYQRVAAFLQGTRYYYECEDCIFTHGWLPIDNANPRDIHLLPDWRNAPEKAWRNAMWLEWQQLYATRAKPQGKTLVCGHRSASMAYWFDKTRSEHDYTTFAGEGVVALDACTVRSGIVNVWQHPVNED